MRQRCTLGTLGTLDATCRRLPKVYSFLLRNTSAALQLLRRTSRPDNEASIMDFAPYQDTAPERTRALSPPPQRSTSRSPNPKSPPPTRGATDPFLPAPSHFSDEPRGNGSGFGNTDLESGRTSINLFETSLPLRLDHEAILAYLLLPPAGGVFLLLVEHKSDYVRYVERWSIRAVHIMT